jgi:hypothetical protein
MRNVEVTFCWSLADGKSVYDFQIPLKFVDLNFLNCKAVYIYKDQPGQSSTR